MTTWSLLEKSKLEQTCFQSLGPLSMQLSKESDLQHTFSYPSYLSSVHSEQPFGCFIHREIMCVKGWDCDLRARWQIQIWRMRLERRNLSAKRYSTDEVFWSWKALSTPTSPQCLPEPPSKHPEHRVLPQPGHRQCQRMAIATTVGICMTGQCQNKSP
jgi:hypothetical protein